MKKHWLGKGNETDKANTLTYKDILELEKGLDDQPFYWLVQQDGRQRKQLLKKAKTKVRK